MLARLQQAITVAIALFSFGWAAFFVHIGHPRWAPVGLVLVAGVYAGVLGIEFVLLRATHGSDPTPRARPGQLLRAWIAETLHGPRLFCWLQPFRSRAEPDLLPDGATQRGVVLVHGLVCNRAVWSRWLPRLRARGIPFVAVDLEPVFGSIDDYAPLIERAVARLERTTGRPPVIVAHSMGGMAVRAWLAAHGAARRVQHVVTIGSPHHGTWLARFSHTPNGMQMAIGNDWLAALSRREASQPQPRYTCFYGHCDNIVFPPSTACLHGADNVHLAGWPHVRMVEHPQVFDATLALLRQ